MSAVKCFTLTNDFGTTVEIVNVGASIKSIRYPINGQLTDMIVTYDNSDAYLDDLFYLGATCGRVANRISDASFELDGERYDLSKNDGKNCLHGGELNFSKCLWQEKAELTQTDRLTLVLQSNDGEQGFPGKLEIEVCYYLSGDNKLKMSYRATTNKATPVNITNHSYFNLGEKNGLGLALKIDADNYLERNDDYLPTGAILPTANSDFCFNADTVIGERQNQSVHPQVMAPGGFDHCFVLKAPLEARNPVAVLTSYINKVKMSLYTNQPALQLYTGSFLRYPLSAYQGVCLEAQAYCDAVSHNNFPSIVLRSEHIYTKEITFHFETI
jgi:aldose 1-epimerase